MSHAQALSIAIMMMWFGCACLILGLAIGGHSAGTSGSSSVVGKEGA